MDWVRCGVGGELVLIEVRRQCEMLALALVLVQFVLWWRVKLVDVGAADRARVLATTWMLWGAL